MQNYDQAFALAQKWINKIGLGFHPDNAAADYSPALSDIDAQEYDADMTILHTIDPEFIASADAMEEEID